MLVCIPPDSCSIEGIRAGVDELEELVPRSGVDAVGGSNAGKSTSIDSSVGPLAVWLRVRRYIFGRVMNFRFSML
jgi:hypothetical protein